jgi:hypothetical protein
MDDTDPVGHGLMCLRCRGTDHITNSCSLDWWPGERSGEYSWLYSELRNDHVDFGPTWNTSESAVCDRCRSLALIDLLNHRPSWNSQQELAQAYQEGHDTIRSLGKVGTVQFRIDCHVCQCLFAITPDPSSNDQDLVLFPDWTICRLSKEDVRLNSEVEQQYATCLSIVLRPSSMALAVNFRGTFGDALCLLDSDLEAGRGLGARQVRLQEVDFELVEQWLSSCTLLHGTLCAPIFTDELCRVRLVDVGCRKVVAHPGHPCEYITLSYVWGDVAQPSYKLGETLGVLPQTLEDAIWVTTQLGKRYIWVDSICIDQLDQYHKESQIQHMCSIYSGSYLNLVAVSGTSAVAGLSKVSRMATSQQVTCCIDGKRLVGLMPTLGGDLEMSVWNERAWTFQEATLSSRSVYFSDRQLYFECNGMHCSESLDITRSWSHKLSQASNLTDKPFNTWMMRQVGRGVFRCSLDNSSRRFSSYAEAVHRYAYRKLTFADDMLRAFDGVLKRQRFAYPKGFFFGLPLEDFDWGLVWYSLGSTQRRHTFPTWSWAGWRSIVHYDHHGRESASPDLICLPVHLIISKSDGDRLEQIFENDLELQVDDNDVRVAIQDDPVNEAVHHNTNASGFSLDSYSTTVNDQLLFIDAVCFHFVPWYGRLVGDHTDGSPKEFAMPIGSQEILLRIIGDDSVMADQREGQEETFVIISRHIEVGWVVHHLLLIYFNEFARGPGIAERRTALQLHVPLNRVGDLEGLKPRRRLIVLA